jgi:hypothetical protein
MNRKMDDQQRAAWEAALNDAGFAAGLVRLYPFDRLRNPDDYTAMWWSPGTYAAPTGKTGPTFTPEQLEDCNNHAEAHRVAILMSAQVRGDGWAVGALVPSSRWSASKRHEQIAPDRG